MKKKKNNIDNSSNNKYSITTADKINIVLAILSFLSLIVIIFTLLEMIKDRNATYEPSILINPTKYDFSWNEDGNESWLKYTNLSDGENAADDFKNNILAQDTIVNISIPIAVLYEGELEKLSTVNVGVGTAKDVVFEWNENNLAELNEFLIQCDETKKDFFEIDKSATFNFEKGLLITNPPKNSRLMYMLSNAQETYHIYLPSVYSVLLHEIIKTNKHNNDIPPLILTAKYFDVQGNEKMEVFLIVIDIISYQQELSGAGNATYQLIPAISK